MKCAQSVHLLTCIVAFLPLSNRGELTLSKQDSSIFQHLKIQDLEKSIQYGFNIDMSLWEENIVSANVYVKVGSPSHGQVLNSQPYLDGHLASRNADIVVIASRHLMDTHCSMNRYQCAREIAKLKLDQTSLGQICLSMHPNGSACNENEKYRSADGSCNSLTYASWGKSNTAYGRLLFPAYRDGIESMIPFFLPNPTQPNPGELSASLVKDFNLPDGEKTIAMAIWTIFIGHDLSHTAVSSMWATNKSVECCMENGWTQPPRYTHPTCAPFMIPNNDAFFPSKRFTCMNYVRSVSAMRTDCTFGPREQLNQATHYLDASMIYGSSTRQTLSLRKKLQGQLLTVKNGLNMQYMPFVDGPLSCQFGEGCYRSGDARVNTQPHLTTMHTLWVREHNRVAKELALINPDWSDEIIFQETRQIIIAMIQHVTYNEWLPILLSEQYTKKEGLNIYLNTSHLDYDKNTNPAVSNSFATSILPFANSMVNETLSLYSEDRTPIQNLSLKEYYNRPSDLQLTLLDPLIRSLSTQSTQKIDMMFTSTMTNYLYSGPNNNTFGMDIVSLDIQRSRDHGIPSYTQFRKYCGLKAIQNVQDLTDVMVEGSVNKLMDQYKTWDNIDLLIGALFEKHMNDAMVGETMGCIIKEQFIRTKKGDRFFFNACQIMSSAQVREIRKMTLARLFCNNGNNIKMMQPVAFLLPDTNNTLVPCDSPSIPKVNLTLWLNTTYP